jgi:hypothetical protein
VVPVLNFTKIGGLASVILTPAAEAGDNHMQLVEGIPKDQSTFFGILNRNSFLTCLIERKSESTAS